MVLRTKLSTLLLLCMAKSQKTDKEEKEAEAGLPPALKEAIEKKKEKEEKEAKAEDEAEAEEINT